MTDKAKVIGWWKDLVEKQESDKFVLNPDDEVVDDVATGVLDNEEKKGFKYCPCRLPVGDKRKDLELICPCNFKIQETWKERGECWCSLFVRKKDETEVLK